MEQLRRHQAFDDASIEDERAAFHRMLLQNSTSTIAPVAKPKVSVAFDETTQSAYTHGLEMIYALETVDPGSIRRIEAVETAPVAKSVPLVRERLPQLEFDFGPGFRSWVEPLTLLEPISVLNLSQNAEKSLLEAGKQIIGDLLDFDVRSLGLGQGHIDDIRDKLNAHLQGKDLYRCDVWDLDAFVRAFFRFCDIRAGYVLLQDYGLQNLCRLSLSAAAEVRRAGSERHRTWKDEAIDSWRSSRSREFFWDKMNQTVDALVRPWMHRREGVVGKREILERLQRVSLSPQQVTPFLKWAAHIYCEGQCPIDKILLNRLTGTYCADACLEKTVEGLLQCAGGYFYQKDVIYPLSQLCRLVKTELAKKWIDPSPELVHKALALCPRFRVRKDAGIQIVRLA